MQIVPIGITPAKVVRGLSEKGPRSSCWRVGAEKGDRERRTRGKDGSWERLWQFREAVKRPVCLDVKGQL